jgi:hypothetical protein
VPQDAAALVREAQAAVAYDQVLVLGEPKVGKSSSVVASAAKAFGPGYVINCGSKSGLVPASRRTLKFKWDLVRNEDQLDVAIKEARQGSKQGDYKWIALDDFSLYASWLEQALEDKTRNDKGDSDGRRFWRDYHKRLANVLIRLFDCRAHFYCISHYMELSPEIPGQIDKSGHGIAPLFGGASRKTIPAMFQDVVLMTRDKRGDRVFCVNPIGVYGPACRSLDGTLEIPADVGALHAAFVNASKVAPLRSVRSAAR